jgi:hypothetical protein
LQFAPAGSSGYFWDITPDQRTGNWARDIDNVSTATLGGLLVPEPSGLVLLGTGGLALLGLCRFRRRPSSAA